MTRGIFRFGVFELDVERVELRKAGSRVRLQEQPFRILVLLLSARGAVVTREDLRRALWPEDTFVEFEHGLNAAVNKLRETLGDNAANPRFVETVPRRGYRFIAQFEMNPETVPVAPEIEPARPTSRLPRRAVWAVTLAVVAFAVSGVALLTRRGRETVGEAPSRPLTTYRGREYSPSFSPDGERVVFAWGDERDYDVYIKQIGSEQPLRLTTNPADDMQPVWSPDGRTIAFLRITPPATAAIMLIPTVGGPERKIGELHSTAGPVSMRRLLMWLPDSKNLIIADQVLEGASRALVRLSTVTGQRTQITSPPAGSVGDEAPDLSPDGRTLAFAREINSQTAELFLLPVSAEFAPSGEPIQITQLSRLTSHPLWTADGNELLLVSGAQHARSFMRMLPSASARPRPAFAASKSCSGNIALSRAKGRIAYASGGGDVNIWKLDLQSSAPQPQLVTQSTSLDHMPVFSPDSSRIAFVSNRSGVQQLWVSRDDGSGSEMLVAFDGEVDALDWSPDGGLIAFSAQHEGDKQVFTVPANGGQLKQITTKRSNNNMPSWSHDGKWLYFSSYRQGIWKTSVASETGSPAMPVIEHGNRALESPDGKYLFFGSRGEPARLFRLALDGNKEERLIAPLSNPSTFAVSKTGVYLIAPDAPSGEAPIQTTRCLVRFLPFSSSRPRTIARIDREPAWGMNVSSDERWLLFTQYDRVEYDLMLIEDFH